MTTLRLNAIPQALLLLALPLAGCVVDDAEEEPGSSADTDSSGSSSNGDDGTGGETGTVDSSTGGGDETGGQPGVGGPCADLCAEGTSAPDGIAWTKTAGNTVSEHCGTYSMGPSEDASVAVFSMFQDNIAYNNTGDGDATLQSLTVYSEGDDGKVGEWKLLSDADFSLSPLRPEEVEGSVLSAGEGFSFILEGVPFASGERLGCVVAEFDSGTHVMNLAMRGSTDPMLAFSDAIAEDDSREYSFGSKARAEDSEGTVLTAEGWFDEEMGPGAFAEDGSVYLTGRGVTSQLDVTPIAKMQADGSTGWIKTLRGNALDGEPGSAHVHPRKVTDQTGDTGSAEMIQVDDDGNVYVVTNWEDGGAHRGVLVRFAPDGTVDYARSFLRDEGNLANSGSWFHGLTLMGDRILITGDVYSGFSGDPLLLVLDKDTGDEVWSRAFVAQPGSANPAWSVCAGDEDRAVFTGGSNDGIVVSVSGISTDAPSIDWAKKIDVEGAGVKGTSCDIDDSGVAYVAYFGLSTQNKPSMFAVDASGEALWTAQIGNLESSRNLAQTVVHHEDSIYLGGVLSLTGLDTTAGEGFLMKLAATDGALDWAAIYYTGKGTEETGTHSVKGIGIRGDELVLTGQAYTGQNNYDRYKGYWYDAVEAGAEFEVVKDVAGDMLIDLPNHDPSNALVVLDEGLMIDVDEFVTIEDAPSDADLESLDLEQAGYGFESLGDNAGPGTDADGMIQFVREL
jgi:hypothetical protein